jgi:hypothetical protein
MESVYGVSAWVPRVTGLQHCWLSGINHSGAPDTFTTLPCSSAIHPHSPLTYRENNPLCEKKIHLVKAKKESTDTKRYKRVGLSSLEYTTCPVHGVHTVQASRSKQDRSLHWSRSFVARRPRDIWLKVRAMFQYAYDLGRLTVARWWFLFI